MSRVLDIFKTIAPIPKCSLHASKMYDFIVSFAKSLGFEVYIDNAKNILCKKIDSPLFCIQAHYDMVCIGDVENLEVVEKDGFLSAKNSSLGADNCIGVAYMLSLMEEGFDDVEYLFTNDEEIGLIGAKKLELKLNSKYLINTDTERESDISIGCAGGYDLSAKYRVKREDYKTKRDIYKLEAKNFKGGHSGFDIQKGVKNSIIETLHLLNSLENLDIISIDGGEKLNSIPTSSKTLFSTSQSLDKIDIDSHYFTIERLDEGFENFAHIVDSASLLKKLLVLPCGVLGYDERFKVVSDSINFAKISSSEEFLELQFMGRSNSNEMLFRNMENIERLLELLGFEEIKRSDYFSAWDPEVLELARRVRDVFSKTIKDSEFRVIHAGFECGVLKSHFPNMEMISIGPNIYNPHSLNERVEIKSTLRVYELIKEILHLKLPK